MQLNLSVQTDKPDLYIDYIEATIRTGEKIAINWDKSYIERTENGFYAQFVAVNYYDDVLEESIYLYAEDIPGISIDEFGLYSDIRGPIYFKLDEMEFEEDGREYFLDPSVYSEAGKYSEQDSRIYIIDGQAYRIEKSFNTEVKIVFRVPKTLENTGVFGILVFYWLQNGYIRTFFRSNRHLIRIRWMS